MRLFFLLVSFCSLYAQASEFHLGGKVFDDTYFSTQGYSKTFLQENISLWLEGSGKLTDHFSIKGIYQGDGIDGRNSVLTSGYDSFTWRSRLREGYGEYSSESFIIREGRQIISWGKSDGINPTDYFSARDFGFVNPEDDVRRLPGDAFTVNWTPENGTSPFSFIFVWQYIFPQGKALIPPSAIPANIILGGPTEVPVTLENSEFGIKSSYAGQGWDISLSGFRGWNHQPEFTESSRQIVGPSVLVNMAQVYRKVSAIGADGSKSFEKWVLRFEGAYIKTENDDAVTPLSIPSHIDAVVGAEHPMGRDFRIQPQIFIRYFPRYASLDQVVGGDPVSIEINRQVAAANALLLQYQDRTRPSGSFRVAYTPEGSDWNGEVFFIYNFAGGDYLIKPQVTYRPVDNLRFIVGADQYGGDLNKPLGSLRAYNSIYFEGKYFF